MVIPSEERERGISLSGYGVFVTTHHYLRRFLLLLCLAAIFLSALSPITLGVPFVFLIPVWFFFAAVLSIPIASAQEVSASPLLGFVPIFSPRPPPLR
jgi:hypothetical protein